MKRFSLIIMLAFLSSFSSASQDKTNSYLPNEFRAWWKTPDSLSWASLPNNLVGCEYTAGAYLNGLYYQICGIVPPNTMYVYMQIYNNSSWSQSSVTNPGGGIYFHCATVWNGKIIVSGGQQIPGYYAYTTIYDPSSSTWVQSTPMPYPGSHIYQAAMASTNNKCYLIGGQTGSGMPLNSTYEWTPSDVAMIPKSGMPSARSKLAVAVCNGIIYAFGGMDNSLEYTNTIFAYNPVSNQWITKLAHLTHCIAFMTAVTMGNKIYIIGGSNGSATPYVDIYDTTSDTVIVGTNLPQGTYGHASAGYTTENSNTSYTGYIYVSGGSLGTGAYIGTVTGVYCNKVQPTSLGNLKALYHQ